MPNTFILRYSVPNDTIPGINRESIHTYHYDNLVSNLKQNYSTYPIKVLSRVNTGREVANQYAVSMGREEPIFTENDVWELEIEAGLLINK